MRVNFEFDFRSSVKDLSSLENYVNNIGDIKDYVKIKSEKPERSDNDYLNVNVQYQYDGDYYQGFQMFEDLLKLIKKGEKSISRLESEAENEKRYREDLEELKKRKNLLEIGFNNIGFSTRVRKAFFRAGITYVGDIVKYSSSELLSFRNFGKTSLLEVRTKLDHLELSLRDDIN